MEGVWMCHIVPVGLGIVGVVLIVACAVGVMFGLSYLWGKTSEHGKIRQGLRATGKVGEYSWYGFIGLMLLLGLCVIVYELGTVVASWLWDCSNF